MLNNRNLYLEIMGNPFTFKTAKLASTRLKLPVMQRHVNLPQD